MGISKAKGMVLADRALGRRGRVFVLLGDGELQEGQIWESMLGAASLRLHEITAIVDHNRLQSDTFVERTSSLGDLRAKFAAFGWHVEWVDGHDLTALGSLFERLRGIDSPKVVIAHTVKGRGVSFTRSTPTRRRIASTPGRPPRAPPLVPRQSCRRGSPREPRTSGSRGSRSSASGARASPWGRDPSASSRHTPARWSTRSRRSPRSSSWTPTSRSTPASSPPARPTPAAASSSGSRRWTW